MDTKLIMEYYGIACAVLLPVCLVLVVVFARKGGLIDKVNNWLDRIFFKPTEPSKDQKTEETEKDKKPTDWEKNSEVMTCLKMKTGDTYLCILTDMEKTEVGSQREWRVSEPFVGKIDDKTSVFTALKAGRTYVECGDVRIYYIEVSPRSKEWFAADIYKAFAEGMTRQEMKVGCFHDKKVREVPSTKLQIEITDIQPAKSAVIQFNKKNICHRVLYKMPDNPSVIGMIQGGMKERMEEIKTDNGYNIRFWVHFKGRKEEEVVDYAAFMLPAGNKTILFGFGPNWRQDGSIEEFRANPGMFLQTFASVMDENELPEIQAALTEEKQQNEPEKESPAEPEHNKNDHDAESDEHHDQSAADTESGHENEGSTEDEQGDSDNDWDADITDDIFENSFSEEERDLDYE